MYNFSVTWEIEAERNGKYWSASLIAVGPACERGVARLTRDPEKFADDGRRMIFSELVYGETEEEAASNLMLLFRERLRKLLDPDYS